MGTNYRQSGSSDQELIELYRSTKDPQQVAVLWGKYKHLILANSKKHLGHSQEAEDVCAEIYVELVEKLLVYPVDNFKSWLYKIVQNHCLQKLRKRKGIVEIDIDSEKFENAFVENPAFEHLDNEGESDSQKLHGALSQLKEEQRTCLMLFFFEEKSYKEISDRTSFDLGQVKSFIQNGKRNLLLILSKTI
jgi:RNA polymerase sigma-70 factor (ECF subfamily)